ncbi:hypothetical protein FOCC_FOCC015660 [Frankliniella occidentalis]|nr:hypothetical protein FOCC_FOCC015660 [Frankliniella occidentalis]
MAENSDEDAMDMDMLPPPAVVPDLQEEEDDDLWTSLDRNVKSLRASRQHQPQHVPPGDPDELLRYLALPEHMWQYLDKISLSITKPVNISMTAPKPTNDVCPRLGHEPSKETAKSYTASPSKLGSTSS